MPIEATAWREGHDAVTVAVVWQSPDGRTEHVPMSIVDEGMDRWRALIVPDRQGPWSFRVVAWSDPWRTWRAALDAKLAAGVTADLLANDLELGARLLVRQARRDRTHSRVLRSAAAVLRDEHRSVSQRIAHARSAEVTEVFAANPIRELVTRGARHQIWVDRPRARFGSWYELFPRSTGEPGEHGSFATTEAELPRIAEMGFDVVYLPPVHPIGTTHRKGRNNSLSAGPADVGSPWAIGSADGGHDAVHPRLGDLADFDRMVARARGLDLEIALDLALQCAPDHPWVREHPEWFTTLPDNTIAHAENPPKVYEDIVPFNFDNDPDGLYTAIRDVVLFWVGHGVRIFRVDNPHTKPMPFWHRLIWDVKDRHPDVLFLAEAFTRPPMVKELARLGFTQSYTYFTWRDSKAELTDYLTELAGETEALRPNFFVNTPDILPVPLHHAGLPAFAIRAALAALLAPTWGMYSGFELGENTPVRAGSEEYLSSEKYELRHRDHRAAARRGRSIAPWISRLNQIRRAHPALQQLRTLRFHDADSDDLLVFTKSDPLTDDTVICLITLDPGAVATATVRLDLPAIGLDPLARFVVRDEVTGEVGKWAATNQVEIDPARAVAHVLAVTRA